MKSFLRCGRATAATIFIMLFVFAFSQQGWGQVTLPHYEGLNYTVGQSLDIQTNWTSLNSGDALLMTSGNLSYNNMPTSTGNKITFDAAGIDAAKLFTQQTSGTVYYSFLVNVTALGSLNTTGGYFTGFTEGATTSFGGTVWLRSDGAGYDIGINPRTTAANTVWSSGTTAINGTHLVVISYQIVASTGNDVVKLWLDPTWGNAEPAATLTATNTGGTDLANVNRILIRQDAVAATPFVEMDEFRIGTSWQSVASTVNGSIASGEYGTHTNGQNQQTNGAVWYMTWDDNNLYIALSNLGNSSNSNNRKILFYIDKDPLAPINGGSNANGNLTGFSYSNSNLGTLPFRADCFFSIETGYRQLNTANGSGGWSANNTSYGIISFGSSNDVMEMSIPWSTITGGGSRPSSFAWTGYVTDGNAGGNYFFQMPLENPSGVIGSSIPTVTQAGFERYYTVSTTTVGSSTPPFSRNSYVFNRQNDATSFGAISVYDFTMNSTGRFISRTGATTQNWSVAGNLVVGAGTIYFGSGGTNGSYGTTNVTGNVDVGGGTLDMDQTTSALTIDGNLSLSSGSLNLSANSFGGGDIKIKGNWTKSGGTFTPNTRAVFFNGTGTQTVNAGGSSFDYFLIQKSNGGITLSADLTVNTQLDFNNTSGTTDGKGIITTSTNKVILGSGATILNAGTKGWVNGNVQIPFAAGSNISKTYPVGDATNYTPLVLTFPTVSNAGSILVGAAASNNNLGTSVFSATKFALRQWKITNGTVAPVSYNGTATYVSGDLQGGASTSTIFAGINSTGSTWVYPTTSGRTTSAPLTVSFTGATSDGNLQLGDCNLTAPTPTVTAPTCVGGTITLGTADATNGASATYAYAWTSDASGNPTINNSTSASASVSNALATYNGTYTVQLTESKSGCFVSPTVAVTVNANPTATYAKTHVSSCNAGNDGAIAVTATSGLAPFTYSLNSGTYGGSNNFTGLTPADYTIDTKDANGCIVSATGLTINQVTQPVLSLLSTTNASSCTGTDGTISVAGQFGVPNFNYTLTPGNITQGSNTFTGLSSGTYSVSMTDAAGCAATATLTNIQISQTTGSSVSIYSKTDASCGNSNGTVILARVGGGIGPFTYSINNGGSYQSSNSFSNLPSGSYTALIKDSKNCASVSGTAFTITQTGTPVVSLYSKTDASCSLSNGTIKLARSGGGVSAFQYSIDNGSTYQSSNVFSNLAAGGTYTPKMKDGKGCESASASTVPISQSGTPVVSVYTKSDASCNISNGSVILARSGGGVAAFQYSVDNGVTYQGSNVFNNLPAAAYTAKVKDSKGCESVSGVAITISQTGTPVASLSAKTNESSCNSSDGSITIARTGGGAGPFTYSVDGLVYQGSNVFNGLAAGSYSLTARDSKSCISSGVAVSLVKTAAPLVSIYSKTNVSCLGGSNGSITVARSGGGIAPFQYSKDGFSYQAGNVFSGLVAGNYTITVKDAKNCTASTASTTVADGTGPCTPSAFADAETGTGTSIKTASHGTLIKIQAYPNPATTVFTLQVKSSSNEKVTINVTNMFGKSAYTTTGSGNQQYSFGKNFLPGVYLVQVMQGKDVQTIKVIKQ